MRLLLDHNVNRRLRPHLVGHDVKTAREMGWEQLANGVLLATAASASFDAFLSIDKKLEHEQNLRTLPLPVIVIDSVSNALPAVLPFVPTILKLLATPLEPALYLVDAKQTVHKLLAPRP